jgi:hypothetical protein
MATLPVCQGIKLANIPLDNLRMEFMTYRSLLAKPEFRACFDPVSPKPIRTPYMTWYGMPEPFLTHLLQNAIVGIEAYTSGAVFFELGDRGMLSRENLDSIKNPFRLGRKGTADNVYNRLPALVSEECSLKNSNASLWASTVEFYAGIRNPLFHGYQITETSVSAVALSYEMIAKLHMWVDSWHKP